EVWYSDGSVILQAESTYFRVHMSILAQHSSVFRDMFALGKADCELVVEGCPIVFLSDTAQDLEFYLKALYNPFPDQKPKQFIEVAALLRLGRKYGIDQLRDDALARITYEFPHTLEKWDSRQIGSRIALNRSTYVDCINLCRELGLFSPLPTALYGWMHYLHDSKRLQEIFTGIARPDHTIAALSSGDQRLSVTALEKLLTTQWAAFAWLSADVDGCTEPQRCATFRTKMKDRLCIPSPKLSGMRKSHAPNTFTRGLCDKCATYANDGYEWGRQEIWANLPTNFGLPPWEEL
ncbi:hypothetical protein BDN72DRAFT_743683, partial [Pluteus cervinus]